MSPSHGLMFPPLLSCTHPIQLADFCAIVVPCIWAGSFNKQTAMLNPKRYLDFKHFCAKIFKATQISCACILLALYYIHRLRSAYPSVRASIGSEIRLFTTALVLANKYLDDNTYTNKTWSDVSHIPVTELNIMEMEFLSALNYSIYISNQQFFAWSNQCQQWYTSAQQTALIMHQRPIKVPTRLSTSTSSSSVKSNISPSLSMPIMVSSPHHAVKRSAQDSFSPSAKRLQSIHHPLPPVTTTSTTTSVTSVPTTIAAAPTPQHPLPLPVPASLPQDMPYTPPNECQPYPFVQPPQVPTSSYPLSSNHHVYTSSSYPILSWSSNQHATTVNSVCRPILSWSSSSLSSTSRLPAIPIDPYRSYSAASVHAAAVAAVHANYPTALLAHRVRCLEIE
ncbi:cyclin-domain-containing protein [Radiomyces spectabilis]|uniref:cyclin-domain-containing protein n=1 Tax=Radiomyces spectabilis TaxID=64574 RepID=UPI00221E6B7F|nr:cyclin-domain-containing protein [Radiomyces spectabilis]KAI8365260.1 cyclin-domain-containing protein [Radiomyces spectabilis]